MNLDLNSQNYKLQELEEIMELPSGYDASIVEMKETKMRQNIMNDSSVDQKTKTKTIQFLKEVKKMIIDHLTNKTGPKTTLKVEAKNSSSMIKNDIFTTDVANKSDETIIAHQVDPYMLTNPSKYFKGSYNPLDKKIVKKSINIDTRFRDNYYDTEPSNFSIELPMKFNNVVSMQLTAMELPTSFYNVDKTFGNNFFALVNSEQNKTQMIIIPDGNYTYADLINEINSIIFNLSDVFFQNITFTLDINRESGSGRVIVGIINCEVNPHPVTQNFILNFQTDANGNIDRSTPLPLKFGWMLGFRNGMYSNNISYVSEGLIDLSAPRYVFLCIDDFNNSANDGFYSIFSSSVLNKNILARISVRGNVFNYMAQNNLNLTTYPREYFGPINLNKMNIQLLDEYGRILNLHNMDYSFCLTFDILYDF